LNFGHGIIHAGVYRDGPILGREFEFFAANVHGEYGSSPQRLGQLDGGGAQATHAEYGHGFSRLKARFAQRVQGRGRGTHHDGAVLKGDFVG
jgi:hypothetical protein